MACFGFKVADPFFHVGGLKLIHEVEELSGVVADDEVVGVLFADEALVGGVPDEAEDVVVKAIHVVEGHGFVEDAELAEHVGLEELVHGAQASRHGDEAVSHVLEDLLALGHGIHDDQLIDVVIAHVHVVQMLSDGADDLAFVLHHHIGDDLHQTHTATPIEKLALAFDHGPSQLGGFLPIDRVEAHAASTENTDLLHETKFLQM